MFSVFRSYNLFMKNLILIHNARIVDANIDLENSAILIEDGKIAGFPEKDAVEKLLADDSVEKIDAEGRTVMPSFTDTHAHFRDPGFTYKEDIESGCRASVKGGYTTLVLMPNTNPPASREIALENHRKADSLGLCQVIQTVSITSDFDGSTVSHIEGLDAAETPVISEDGKEVRDSAVMFRAMKMAAGKNLLVACHCEDPFLADAARPLRKEALTALENPTDENRILAEKKLLEADNILRLAEDTATLRNIELAKNAGCRLHLCHVSTEKCIEALRDAKKSGMSITAEITPHHISMGGEKMPGIFNIVNPPLRHEKDMEILIEALRDGTADCIGTDHAPHSAEDKKNGSPGFSGIETSFAVCNSVLVKEKGFTLSHLSRLMSANPAKILGLGNQGLLEEGYDANLVIADVDEKWTVRGEEFASKGKFTPLEGRVLTGKIKQTMFRGKIVYKE